MRCEKPTQLMGSVFPCGQCTACRIKRRREWAHRIELEAALRKDNCFVTLTYSDRYLPWLISMESLSSQTLVDQKQARSDLFGVGHISTLEPSDLQNWLKRFRKEIDMPGVRFYAVGEYGEKTGRPHYHLAIFGFPTCLRGRTYRMPGKDRPLWEKCCDVCRIIGRTWKWGDVDLGTVEEAAGNYVAQYVTKKLTDPADPRLYGRVPEFSRQSNRAGGIGLGMMKAVAEVVRTARIVETQGDVPVTLRIGSKEKPLGRYLRRKLRKEVGLPENAPAVTLEKMALEMRPLQEIARTVPRSLSQVVAEANEQKVLQLKQKAKIFKQRNKL